MNVAKLASRILLAAPIVVALNGTAPAYEPAYRIVKQIAIGAPEKWDFLYFDSSSDRIFIAHGTEVTVVDGAKGTIIGRLSGLNTSHGIVTVPALGRGYADSSKTNSVIVFDLKTLKPLMTLAAGTDPDAMTYDPKTKRVFVMDGDGAAVTAIDAVAGRTLSTIALGGSPESAVGDGAGRIFINLADTNELVSFNAATLAVDARWPLSSCTGPHGLSFDAKTHRLFVSCENQVLVAVSSDSGKTIASLPIGKGTDADAFDSSRGLIFSANADATLSVIAEKDAEHFTVLPAIATTPGARTLTLDPRSGRLYLVTGSVSGMEPSAKPGHAPHVIFVPGSLKLTVLEPK